MSAVRQGPSAGGSGGGGAGALPAGRSGMGDDVPAHPWLAARRFLGRIAEWCWGELCALPYQSAVPSPLLAEAPGPCPASAAPLAGVCGRPYRAEAGERKGGGGGGHPRPPPGGARWQRPGRHVGAGGLQHRRRGQRLPAAARPPAGARFSTAGADSAAAAAP